jgi:hypothetical protein
MVKAGISNSAKSGMVDGGGFDIAGCIADGIRIDVVRVDCLHDLATCCGKALEEELVNGIWLVVWMFPKDAWVLLAASGTHECAFLGLSLFISPATRQSASLLLCTDERDEGNVKESKEEQKATTAKRLRESVRLSHAFLPQ